MSDADAAVRDHLATLGVAYQLVPCDPDLADTAAFCRAYGYSLGDSANTIIVIGKSDPPVYAACVLLADSRLDVNGAVRLRLRARRPAGAESDGARRPAGAESGGARGPAGAGSSGLRRASFASAEQTAALTGMMIGGVTVFGLPADLPVWVDDRVMTRPQIVLGGGSRNWKVVAPPDILRHLPNVEIVPSLAVAVPAPPG
jgi:prolyl-tRNA editing enzyme YbaK/EbsC (Cys-tRNA(Pro) deacylase)